jgi:hypothetical protein
MVEPATRLIYSAIVVVAKTAERLAGSVTSVIIRSFEGVSDPNWAALPSCLAAPIAVGPNRLCLVAARSSSRKAHAKLQGAAVFRRHPCGLPRATAPPGCAPLLEFDKTISVV